jgi:hypothetical protein
MLEVPEVVNAQTINAKARTQQARHHLHLFSHAGAKPFQPRRKAQFGRPVLVESHIEWPAVSFGCVSQRMFSVIFGTKDMARHVPTSE